MIVKYTTHTNANGNKYQLEVDHEAKTYKNGFNLFYGSDADFISTKTEIEYFIKKLSFNGFVRG